MRIAKGAKHHCHLKWAERERELNVGDQTMRFNSLKKKKKKTSKTHAKRRFNPEQVYKFIP